MPNPSVWLTTPMLLAGGSTLVHALDTRTPTMRRRAVVLSILALTLGSATMYIPCSPGARIIGVIDIIIGALVIALVF
jgi:hypothetical protein